MVLYYREDINRSHGKSLPNGNRAGRSRSLSGGSLAVVINPLVRSHVNRSNIIARRVDRPVVKIAPPDNGVGIQGICTNDGDAAADIVHLDGDGNASLEIMDEIMDDAPMAKVDFN